MIIARREFLKGTGALVLSLGLQPVSLLNSQEGPSLPGSLSANPELDRWIRIDAAGHVTLFMGKVEIGQGILTSLSQIAAEELDLEMARVRFIQTNTRECPEEFMTAGSLSIQQSGSALRLAAARARQILIHAAAQKLGVDQGELQVREGRFLKGTHDTGLDYWQLLGDRKFNTVEYEAVPVKDPSDYAIVGQSVPRVDIPGKVFGQPVFIHDFRPEGMVHARLVRPPTPGSRLGSIDSSTTESQAFMEGVLKIVRDGSFLAVVAQREETAIKAADELQRHCGWTDGMDLPDANRLTAWLKSAHADVDTVGNRGKEVDHTQYNAEYFRPYQAHASMSPSIGLARYDGGKLEVWTHSQGIYNVRAAMARALGLKASDVHCQHMMGSGCYGHNNADDAACDAALIAMQLPGVPVRLQYSRDDEFRWEPFGSAMALQVGANLDDNGTITDWSFDVWSCTHSTRPGGADTAGNLFSSQLLAEPVEKPPLRNIPQPTGGGDRNAVPLYHFANMQVHKHFVRDMPLRVSALRGLGAFANVFAIESFMDELAGEAEAEPIEFRLRHLEDPRAIAVLEAIRKHELWLKYTEQGGLRGRGVGFARYKNLGAYCAVAMFLQVDPLTGIIQLEKGLSATDAGLIINPDGVRNQIEGGIIQGASWTLKEAVRFNGDAVTSLDWASYPTITFSEVPELESILIARPDLPSVGTGEASQGPVAAAIGNALADAIGVRLRDLPLTPEKISAAYHSASSG